MSERAGDATGTHVYRPGWQATWLLFGAGVVTVALALWFFLPRGHTTLAWVGGVSGALMGVVGGLQLLPGVSYLQVDDDGFTVRSLGRAWRLAWSEVSRFGVAEVRIGLQTRRHVGCDLNEAGHARVTREGLRTLSAAVRTFNRQRTGFEGALPDSYGWKVEELAAHLEALRVRHAPASGPAA